MTTQPTPGDAARDPEFGASRPSRQRPAPKRTWRSVVDAVVVATVPEVRRQRREAETRRKAEVESGFQDEIDATFALWDDTYATKTAGPESYTCCPPPIFVPAMTLAQIIIFAIYAARLQDVTLTTGGVDFKSPFIYDPVRRHEAWRFLSYALLHYGLFHLLTNAVLQLSLGVVLELQHKIWRVAPLYLLGAIAGSLASSVFDPFVFLVGASGGVYALLGGHLATVIINWAEMQRNWKESAGAVLASGVVRLTVVLVIVFADTGVAVYTRYTAPMTAGDDDRRISYAAHLGAFAAGVLAGVPLLRNLKIRGWEKVLCVVFLVAYGLLVMGAVLFNVLCPARLCPRVTV